MHSTRIRHHQLKLPFPLFAIGISLGLVFLLGLLALAMAVVCASRAAVKSAISYRTASKVMAGVSDVDVLLGGILSTQDNEGYGMIHEDGDNDANHGNDDEVERDSWKTISHNALTTALLPLTDLPSYVHSQV
ncbi:hypothetical protein Tco_1246194 [Tanacetum coccineum]